MADHKAEFKPRLDKNVCQYCGYTSVRSKDVDKHVTTQHELNIWYQCNLCENVTIYDYVIKRHMRKDHQLKIEKEEVSELIVKDPKKIHDLRRDRHKGRRKRNHQSKVGPVDESNFKSRIKPMACQYCDFKSKYKYAVDIHVNANHELTDWYKCNRCDYVTPVRTNLMKHLLKVHEVRTNAKDLLITDQEEIRKLRMKRAIRKTLKNQEIQGKPRKSKPKEMSCLPVNERDFKPRLKANVCQYCGHIAMDKDKIDVHVNDIHEMVLWYECYDCTYVTTNSSSLASHMRRQHEIRVTRQIVKQNPIKDKEKIKFLKRKKIKEFSRVKRGKSKSKVAKDQCSVEYEDSAESSVEDEYPEGGSVEDVDPKEKVSMKEEEIEIEEHSLDIEIEEDLKIPDNNSLPCDLDEEWLSGPSW